MKKILLGVAALTSIATLADTQYPDFHGYLNSETSANVNNELENNKFKNEGKPQEAGASQKLTFGTFLHKDAQLYVFAGLKGDYVKFNAKNKTDANSGVTGVDVPNYYFGARWDAPIVDDFNIALTFGHKHKYYTDKLVYDDYKQDDIRVKKVKVEEDAVLEDVVVKHLKAKNKLNQAKLDSKDDKEGYLKDNGYKLAAKDNTELLSAVLSGKIDDNFDLTVAGLYNSTEFNDGTHELESYAKTSGKLTDNFKVSGEVNHLIKSETYDVAGRLKGEVKLESQLNKNTLLTNTLKGELKNILGNKHDGEFVSENGLKYTGFSNTVVEQGLNYKLEINAKAVETPEGDTTKDGATKFVHTPEYKVDLSYTGKNAIFTTKNSEKVEVKLAKKDSAVNELNNVFKTYNNIKYVNGGFELGLDANYDLKTNLLAKPHLNGMKFLTGPTLKYTYNDEDVLTVTTDNSAKYLLTVDSVKTGEKAAATDLQHEGLAFTKNKAVISELFGVDTEVKLNAHNYVIAGELQNDFVSFTDMLLTNAGVKFTKEFNDTTKASLDVNGNYFLKVTNTKFDDAGNPEKSDKILLDHFGSADATLNITSTLSENADRKVDLITEVKGEYKYMKLGSKYIEGFAKFVEAAGYTDGEYRVLDGYVAKEFNSKDQEDFIKQGNGEMFKKSRDVKHSLAVKPSVAVKFDITKNLSVTPKLGANFEFDQKLADGSKFTLNKVTGEGSLNISYTW